MTVFGTLPSPVRDSLEALVASAARLLVTRDGAARSTTPYPKSTDIEAALRPLLTRAGFLHHNVLRHWRTGGGFEYDFSRRTDGDAGPGHQRQATDDAGSWRCLW